MKDIYPPKVKKLLAVFTTRPAETTQELRQTVTAYAARLGGAARTAEEVPEEIEGYIDKVTRHAYKVADEDFLQLKKSGYSEDQIFEITLAASLGAGLARLECGMAVLEGEK
jgi:alkylhydroperoxidase family enzyme